MKKYIGPDVYYLTSPIHYYVAVILNSKLGCLVVNLSKILLSDPVFLCFCLSLRFSFSCWLSTYFSTLVTKISNTSHKCIFCLPSAFLFVYRSLYPLTCNIVYMYMNWFFFFFGKLWMTSKCIHISWIFNFLLFISYLFFCFIYDCLSRVKLYDTDVTTGSRSSAWF